MESNTSYKIAFTPEEEISKEKKALMNIHETIDWFSKNLANKGRLTKKQQLLATKLEKAKMLVEFNIINLK